MTRALCRVALGECFQKASNPIRPVVCYMLLSAEARMVILKGGSGGGVSAVGCHGGAGKGSSR